MMGRAERRRAQKLEQKAKTATYNLTKAQLDAAVREQVGKELERIKQEATDDAINTAMVQKDGKIQKVSLKRIYDVQEV